MAEVAGTLISTVLRRARDPQGTATSRTLTRALLSDVQRLVNAGLNKVVTTAALTTNPYRVFYPITVLIPTSVRVIAVEDGDRNLQETTLKRLAQYDTQWHRRINDKFEAWAPAGRDLLVVWPAKDITSSVTIRFTKLTDDLIDENEATDLPDSDLLDVLDLTEVILHIKGRNFDQVRPLMDRLTGRFRDRATSADV